MMHLTIAMQNLQYRLAERNRDEEGGLSVEWLALAAAMVVILLAVSQSNTISNAISTAFDSMTQTVSGNAGGGGG